MVTFSSGRKSPGAWGGAPIQGGVGAPAPTSGRSRRLKDDADQAAAPLVDDALHRLLELDAGVGGHTVELVVQPLVDQLVQGVAEDVGLPDLAADSPRTPAAGTSPAPPTASRCPRWAMTSVVMSAFIMWMEGAAARRRMPYRPLCLMISGSSRVSSSSSGMTMP